MKSEHLRNVVQRYGTPTYVYSETTLRQNLERINQAKNESDLDNELNIHIPYFVNSNPHLFDIINEHAGITIQSVEEYHQLQQYNLTSDIIVSPTHLSDDDLEFFITHDLPINAGTFTNLEKLLEQDAEPRARIDISPPNNQRQNLRPGQFGQLENLLQEHDTNLHGMHIYPGTKNELDVHLRYQRRSLECYERFADLKEINLGGGFKYEYEDAAVEERHFDWNTYFNELGKRCEEFDISSDVTFVIEPGRDVFVDAGELILHVNHIEDTFGTNRHELFTDGSYVHMPSANIRPRAHRQEYFDADYQKLNEAGYDGVPALISGNTTLSSDRVIPKTVHYPRKLSAGDYIVIKDVGAYCATQHLEFLNKRPLPEALISEDETIQQLTRRGSMTDRTRYVLDEPTSGGAT